MPIPSDKYKKVFKPKFQMYQLWLGHPNRGGEMLAEDYNLNRLLRFAKEQIKDEAWAVDEYEYKNFCLIRTEIMELDFRVFMKGTGLKRGKK